MKRQLFLAAVFVTAFVSGEFANAGQRRYATPQAAPAFNPLLFNLMLNEGKQVLDKSFGTNDANLTTTTGLPPTTTVPKTKQELQSLMSRLDAVNAKLKSTKPVGQNKVANPPTTNTTTQNPTPAPNKSTQTPQPALTQPSPPNGGVPGTFPE